MFKVKAYRIAVHKALWLLSTSFEGSISKRKLETDDSKILEVWREQCKPLSLELTSHCSDILTVVSHGKLLEPSKTCDDYQHTVALNWLTKTHSVSTCCVCESFCPDIYTSCF